MKPIKLYHLHKEDSSGLHFEINDAKSYIQKNMHHVYKPHRHSFYQIIWFKTPGKHHIDYETFYHEANTLFFINKTQVHHFCPDSENDGCLFHFNDEFLNREANETSHWKQFTLFSDYESPMIEVDQNFFQDVDLFTDLMLEEFENKSFHFDKQLHYLFMAFLLKIEREKRKQSTAPQIENDREVKLLGDFRKLVDKYVGDLHGIDFFSDQLGVSSKKLTNTTKDILGETPGHIIAQRKTLEAKRLLSNTDLSIKQVAYQLGFDQATYFTKYFKKNAGVTPKEFIKSHL